MALDDLDTGTTDVVLDSLRRIAAELPKAVRFRIENAFQHIDRSLALLPIDREMASFRAITAEEEAVTALLTALRLHRYPNWKRLNARFHTHKAAVLLAIEAIQLSYARGLTTFQLVFDFEKRRIDVKIPLSEFGVRGAGLDDLCIQPVEPLDLYHARKGLEGEPDQPDYFARELAEIVARSEAQDLWSLVKERANQRNTLLYASDNALPSSKFNGEGHAFRRRRVMLVVALTVMILQSREHLTTVRQAMKAILDMVSRMPSDAAT